MTKAKRLLWAIYERTLENWYVVAENGDPALAVEIAEELEDLKRLIEEVD